MANENNNINKLAADDDPTVELEAPKFSIQETSAAEADAKTFSTRDESDEIQLPGVCVSELQSDIRSQKKTINRLQYDFQQLHSKSLGLESEINAREEQTIQLNNELASTLDALSRKQTLLKKRDRKIESLKSEIRQRDDDYRHLTHPIVETNGSTADALGDNENSESLENVGSDHVDTKELKKRLIRTEKYADTIRRQSHDLIESNSHAGREVSSLSRLLEEATQSNVLLTGKLGRKSNESDERQAELDTMQARHDDEIRLLRFDLGEAQNTVVNSEELNGQLASDLVDAHSSKNDLERILGDAEEQSANRIADLEKAIKKLTRMTETYEQRLTTKSEALSLLLAELARKTDQVESIGKIDDVIQNIDERISERSKVAVSLESQGSTDRVTRVLIGTVDDQFLRFPLFKDRLTIGRTKDNDIQLEARYVSRRHAVLQTDQETTRIIDWGSKNGIHVNSSKVSEHILSHGDIVMIGIARFRYEERKKHDS